MPDSKTNVKKSRLFKAPRIIKFVLTCFGILVVALLLYAGVVFVLSPASIRNPRLEHYHFRMQILVDGKPEDFSTPGYQTGYNKDQCNAKLPEQPIHFHDNKNQFTHIHWEGMTGGMVMKYYGWNYIGGLPGKLGYKLDKLTEPQPVTIHGDYLPNVPKKDNIYVYTGDENDYQERSFNDWKNQDLEKFFNTTSNFPAHEQSKQSSILKSLISTAYAHGTSDDLNDDDDNETPQEKLTRINNLIGNVVIFVQKERPTDQQIKDRFNKLEPLSDSTCAG